MEKKKQLSKKSESSFYLSDWIYMIYSSKVDIELS